MKKATNPLALDLRAGGFEVFPLAKLFDLPSNVWYPSILIRENMLAEPFAAWAANVFYALGGVQVLQWSDAVPFSMHPSVLGYGLITLRRGSLLRKCRLSLVA